MAERWVLQFCHCHYGPFLDVARQYAALFKDHPYKVLTVYLTGEPSESAVTGSASDEVIFLNFCSKDVSGLKISAILALRKIVASRDIALVIAHRFKPIYIACLATGLPVIGVHHAFGDYKRADLVIHPFRHNPVFAETRKICLYCDRIADAHYFFSFFFIFDTNIYP